MKDLNLNQTFTAVESQGARVKSNGDAIANITRAWEAMKGIAQPKPICVHDNIMKAFLVEGGIPHELSKGKSSLLINSHAFTRIGDYWFSDGHPLLKAAKFDCDFVTWNKPPQPTNVVTFQPLSPA